MVGAAATEQALNAPAAASNVITHDFRHGTGRIERNEMGALISVLPKELVSEIAAPLAPKPLRNTTFAGASRVELRLAEREASRFTGARKLAVAAAAASVAGAGIVGINVAADAQANHEANLLSADSAPTTESTEAAVEVAADAAEIEAATADATVVDPVVAPEAEVTIAEGESSVTTFDADAVASMSMTAEPVMTSADFGGIAESSLVGPMGAGATISSTFGYRNSPTAGASSNHQGIDLITGGGTCGAPLYAVSSGTVSQSGYQGAYGNLINLKSDDGSTSFVYAHLQSMTVAAGQTVAAGELIGYAGATGVSTGCNLHFEVHDGGTPIDPQSWLADRGIL